MRRLSVLLRDHPRRHEAERLIIDCYAENYGARISNFAETLVVQLDDGGEIVCAAGLRGATEGFFSEQYLSEPIEAVLNRIDGREVRRGDIFEVTTLVSRSPRDLPAFIDNIVRYGFEHDLKWSFFTLTSRLSVFVRRRNPFTIRLADADPDRVADPESWGSYYATAPKVYGICGADIHHLSTSTGAEVRYARVS
jgi:hypothetical protein